MPATALLPQLPPFTPTSATASGLDLLAAAASGAPQAQGNQQAPVAAPTDLHCPGPYNPAPATKGGETDFGITVRGNSRTVGRHMAG